MPATLYDIERNLQTILEAWDDTPDAEKNDELEAWFLKLAVEANAERDVLLEQYFCMVEELKARALARKTEAQRMAELAKQDEARAEALVGKVQDYLERNGIKKIDTLRFPIRLVGNGGQLPLLMDADTISVEELDERFVRVSKEVDTKAVRKALEAGEAVPFAQLGERGKHLEWKGRTKKGSTETV